MGEKKPTQATDIASNLHANRCASTPNAMAQTSESLSHNHYDNFRTVILSSAATTTSNSSNATQKLMSSGLSESSTSKSSSLLSTVTEKSSASSSSSSTSSSQLTSMLSVLSSSSSSSTTSSSTSSRTAFASSATAFKYIPTSMNFYKRIAVYLLVILEILLVVPVNAGPVNVRQHRIRRDIYMDIDSNRAAASAQNETQHDGTCLLDGVITKRATIHCETKPGCKAIQKTGYCCPEYQCECEKDGRIYANGETLPSHPQTPCKVCFCKGGEIVCTDVTCYKRDDCEPKYIPGRCCPEYDNCPPLEIGKATTSKSITGFLHNFGSDTTDNSVQKFDQTSAASMKHHQHEMPMHNPLNITIKEITKVEEIRITDAPPVNGVPKPKPSILQSHTTPNPATSNGNKNTISSTTLTQIVRAKDSQQQSLNSIEGKTLEDEVIAPIGLSTGSGGAAATAIGGDAQLNSENTKLTLVETKTILFPATDISPYPNDKPSTTSIPPYSPIFGTTDSNKVLISDNSLLNGEESIKTVRHASVPSHGDKGENNFIQLDGGEKEKNKFAISNEQIGDQVVIIDKNGQSKPITVFGIKGLQRGDVIEDPSLSASSNRFDTHTGKRHDKVKGSSKEYESNENSDIDPIQASSSDDFVRVVIGSTTENINEIGDFSEDYNGTKAGDDDEIYEPVLYTEDPDSSSVSPMMPSSTEEIFNPVHYPSELDAGESESNDTSDESQIYDSVFHSDEGEIVYEPVFHDMENDTLSTSGPENVSSEPFPFEENDEGDVNPAYPKLEDDLSIHREINGAADYLEGNTETKSLVHGNSMVKEEPRSVIDSLTLENQSLLSAELRSESTSESPFASDSYGSFAMENDTFLNDIIEASPEPRVPGEPCLIPEWERLNGTSDSRCNRTYIESSLDNDTPAQLTLLKGNDSWPTSSEVDSEFSDGSGSGLGDVSSNLIDNREPTTRNPNKIIDIDDVDADGSGSGNGTSPDPKHDAESLKLDEDDNESASGSSVGLSGSAVADEINKKTVKSFYGFDSFLFY